jgi:hypothetical protein
MTQKGMASLMPTQLASLYLISATYRSSFMSHQSRQCNITASAPLHSTDLFVLESKEAHRGDA